MGKQELKLLSKAMRVDSVLMYALSRTDCRADITKSERCLPSLLVLLTPVIGNLLPLGVARMAWYKTHTVHGQREPTQRVQRYGVLRFQPYVLIAYHGVAFLISREGMEKRCGEYKRW